MRDIWPRSPTTEARPSTDTGVRAALRAAYERPSKWPFLDGARGLAMTAVFSFHALRVMGGWYSPRIRGDGVPEWLWPFGLARFSIDAFFVLSGFLVVTTWWERRERLGRLWPALRDYVRSRTLRIFPVFWLSLLVLVPLRAPDLLAAPGDLLLLGGSQQYLDPDLPGRFNVVTWSLTVETHFYVLLPLLAFLVRRRTTALLTLAGSVALTVWWFGARGEWPSSVLLGRLDQFVAGMLVAALFRRFAAGERPWAVRLAAARGAGWAMGAVLLAVGIYHGTTLGLPRGDAFDAWQHPVAGLALAGLGLRLLCAERPGLLRRTLEHPWLLVLGAMSYSLYLWHVPLLEASHHVLGAAGPFFSVTVAAGLSFTAAALSYTWVELPFMRRKAKAPSVRDGEPDDTRERVAVALNYT